MHINLTLAKSDCESGEDRSPGALWKVVWLTMTHECYPMHIHLLQMIHTIGCKRIEIVTGTNDLVDQHVETGGI